MNKILTFHDSEKQSAGRLGAAYYLETDYAPVALRIHAEQTPHTGDAEFEILRDGVTIMNNRERLRRNISGVITSNAIKTTVVLSKSESDAEFADDFIGETLEADGWITCKLVTNGGGKNFSVQLELSDESESEDT